MPTIICKKVTFYSPGDEQHFFSWAESIKGVRRLSGVSDEIHIEVGPRLSDRSKHELWGLLNRYSVSVEQLKKMKLLPSYFVGRARHNQIAGLGRKKHS